MLLMLLAASWLCCDANDEKTRLLRSLLSGYEKDVEPPLPSGANTTVQMSMTLLCATPVDDFVSVESWLFLVSRVVHSHRHEYESGNPAYGLLRDVHKSKFLDPTQYLTDPTQPDPNPRQFCSSASIISNFDYSSVCALKSKRISGTKTSIA